MDKKMLHTVSFILVIVGALNWGLVGLFNLDLVATLFGASSLLARLVYMLVGLSGVYIFAIHKETCMLCQDSKKK